MIRTPTIAAVIALHGATAAAQPEETLAVVALEGKGVEADLAASLTDVVTIALTELGVFRVLTRADILQMLQFEQEKQLMGCNTDTSCLAEIGGALGVGLLVSGSVGKLGDAYLLSLTLTDTRTAMVVSREQRNIAGEAQLSAETAGAARYLVRSLLEGKSGELIVAVAERDAEVEVDGRVVGLTPLPPQVLPGGPHRLRVHKKGSISWARDVDIRGGETAVVDVSLVPSLELIEEHEASAFRWRLAAYVAGGLGVGAVAAGTGMYLWNGGRVARFERDLEAARCHAGATEPPLQDCALFEAQRSGIETVDLAAISMMGVGAAAAIAGVVLFFSGPEVGRYDRYRARADAPVVTLAPTPDGLSAAATFSF